MALSAWLAYSFIAAALIGAAILHYRLREPGGPARTLTLGMLRGGSLALVALLLFDPVVPRARAAGGVVVAVVDASLSMSMPGPGGTGRERAWAEVEALDPDRVLLFGDRPSPWDREADAPPALTTRSKLAPALRAAVESGADRVVVITDGAVEDPGEAAAMARAAGVPVELRRVGPAEANLAIGPLTAPAWIEPGSAGTVEVEVETREGAGALPESVTVTLARGGAVLDRARLRVPPGGRSGSVSLRFRADDAAGSSVRLDVAVDPGGSVAVDDTGSVYVRVAEEPAGVALVSFRPGQEPRFLVPVLERALGVPVRGWMRLAEDRYIRVGEGGDAGGVAGADAVRRAVADARLVVLHGVDADAPGWALDRARRAPAVLVFPGDPPPATLPVELGPPVEGDWYVAPDIPSSPVGPLLAGLDAAEAPPLSALRTAPLPPGFWTPLSVLRNRRGRPEPAVAAGRVGRRRVAVAMGTGYWRWAFSGAASRGVYERLWAAVAAWLLEEPGTDGGARVRPAERVGGRGEPVRWLLPPALDSATVRVWPEASGPGGGGSPSSGGASEPDPAGAVVDTTLGAGEPRTPPLPPGHYRYRARAGAELVGEGAFTVASRSPEFTRPPVALELESGDDSAERADTGGGRPLRTAPWPWLVLTLLLAAEWVLRRRWGLR